jgi:hypothetical protein
MKLFKQKKTNRSASAFENIQAKLSPVQITSTATSRELEYEIEIEANMSELVNEDINEIEVISISADDITRASNSIDHLNAELKNKKKQKTFPAKVMSIDPKELLAHGDLGDLASPMIRSNTDKGPVLKDNIIESNITFIEKPISNSRLTGKVSIKDIIDNRISFERDNEPLVNSKSLSSPIKSPFGNLDMSRPVVKSRKEKSVQRVTKKKLTIRVPIGQVPEVRLKNKTGRRLGTVKNNGKMVRTATPPTAQIKNYSYFALLATKRKMFDIAFSKSNNMDFLHVTTPYANIINGFKIIARTLSKTPHLDRSFDLGNFTIGQAKYIPLASMPFNLSKKIMFHVVPLVSGAPICHSHTIVNEGNFDEYDSSCCAIQYLPNVIRFHISNLPIDVKHVYAVRTNDLSGAKHRLPMVGLNREGGVSKTSENKTKEYILNYDDNNVSDINSMYSYDFFIVNRYGLEKHLFRKSLRTYEKDTSGHIFKKAKLFRGTDGFSAKVSMSLAYPDAFNPKNANYSIQNPDDSFFEACRNRKRVCTLSIVKHASDGTSHDLGIYVVNQGELNTLDSKVDKFGNFNVEFEINSEFLKNAGAPRVYNANLDYYYEFRMGSYLLSNELSFRLNPLKLDVPNEFTDGKLGYSFDPYVYETPSRKDYGLIGRLGSSKKLLFQESLTSSAKVMVQQSSIKDYSSVQNRFRANLSNLSSKDHCVVLQMKIESSLLQVADHFELFVGDSTTGEYRSLGKNKIIESEFYYIDAASSELAANKLKYKLVARSVGFENIATFESNLIDISSTNILKRKDDRSSVGQITKTRLDKFKGGI